MTDLQPEKEEEDGGGRRATIVPMGVSRWFLPPSSSQKRGKVDREKTFSSFLCVPLFSAALFRAEAWERISPDPYMALSFLQTFSASTQ